MASRYSTIRPFAPKSPTLVARECVSRHADWPHRPRRGIQPWCFSSPESTTRVKARPRLLRAGRDSLRGSFATGKSAARTGTNRAGVAQSPARLTVPPRASRLPVTSRLHRILRRQPKPPGRRQVSTKTRDESAETQAGTDHGPPRYNTRRPDFCGLSMNTALSVPDRIPSKPR